MTDNRIRELREVAKLTQEELAERARYSVGHISKMETGKRGVSQRVAKRLAEALGRDPAEIYGYDGKGVAPKSARGLSDELLPYDADASDPFAGLKGRNRYLMTVATESLEKKGIRNGDVVVVDGSPEACKSPPPLSAVRVQYRRGGKSSRTVTLLRQFVPPSLLITNCAGRNAESLDLESDDAQILGVIVSSHRALDG